MLKKTNHSYVNVAIELLDNKRSCSNRFILMFPKFENDIRLQAKTNGKG